MGHIGFTPQYFKKFKVQGVLEKDRYKLIEQAKRNQEAGVFSVVLECINTSTAKAITSSLKIPTIGIGASSFCVKKFVNLNKVIEIGIKKYKKAVLNKKFPNKKNIF